MKIRYVLVFVITLFMFNINSKAFLSMCSYKCIRANSSDANNEQALKGQSVLAFDGTRTELYLSFVDELSMTQSSVPIPVVDLFVSKYNSIAYSDMINHSGGTFVRFNPELSRGSFWGNTLSTDRYVDIRWYYPTFNDDGSISEGIVDPKQKYVEDGICPKYFFYDGDDIGEIKSGATLKFADYDSLVDSKSPHFILGGNDFLYRLQWGIIKGYTFTKDDLNTETSLNMWKNVKTGAISIGGELVQDGDIYRPMAPGCYVQTKFADLGSEVKVYKNSSGNELPENIWRSQCMVKTGSDGTDTENQYVKVNLGIGVKDLLLMLLNGKYTSLSNDQLTVATYLLNLKYGTATATDREKFMFTRVLNNYYTNVSTTGEGLYYLAANALVQFSKNENSELHKARYKDLLEAAQNYYMYSTGEKVISDKDVKNQCASILGDVNDKDSFAYYLQMIFRFVQYIGPILVIILTTVDYFKAMMSGDDGATKKVNKRTVTRLIAIVCLFFIPMIIQVLLNLFDITSDCGIS